MRKLFLNEYFLLTIIIVLAFVVRLYKINNPVADWHSWRQSDTASVTRIYVEKGINLLYPKYQDVSSIQTGILNLQGYRYVEFPIFNAIHALMVQNIPSLSLEVLGRLLTIFCAIVSSFFCFLLGRRYIGKAGGLLAAFFFAFLPYNIYFTRVILPDPMGVTFGLASLWLFSVFIDKEKYYDLYLSGIFFALALLIKPFMAFYSLPMLYLLVNKYRFRAIFKNSKLLIRLLFFANIVLIPFFAWRIWVNNHPEGIPFFEWAFNGDGIRFRPAFWRWIFGERLGYLILGTWGLIPFVFGIVNKKKNYFIQFFLLGMLLYVMTVATANVRHDYYQIITIPAIALSMAGGSAYLWKEHKLLGGSLVVFSILVGFITSATQVKEFYKVNHPEIIEAGQALDKIAPKDALVVAPYNGDTAFLYQTGRSGWPAIDSSIDNLIKEGADYYVSVNFSDPDTINFQKEFKIIAKTDKYIILDLTKKI